MDEEVPFFGLTVARHPRAWRVVGVSVESVDPRTQRAGYPG